MGGVAWPGPQSFPWTVVRSLSSLTLSRPGQSSRHGCWLSWGLSTWGSGWFCEENYRDLGCCFGRGKAETCVQAEFGSHIPELQALLSGLRSQGRTASEMGHWRLVPVCLACLGLDPASAGCVPLPPKWGDSGELCFKGG